MRSENVDRFNHDEDADQYDSDVTNTSDPIREGYGPLLDWVADQVAAGSQAPVEELLELGSGTGNLTVRLLETSRVGRIFCVDVSSKMTALAAAKLGELDFDSSERVRFVLCDALEAFDGASLREAEAPERFDAIASTYTLHHLTDSEKSRFAHLAAARLRPSGRLVVGDLAFANRGERSRYLERCRASGRDDQIELAEVIEDEFFWNLETDVAALESAGFDVMVKRFSDLSWGIAATLAAVG